MSVDHDAEAKRYIANIVARLERDGFSSKQINYLLNTYRTEPPITAVTIMCFTDKLLDKLPRDRSMDTADVCLARIISIQISAKDE